jgi:dihydroorotate dehydrogenase electron transfer subunit
VKTYVFKDRECAMAKPGQFLMLWIPGVDEIPLSILDADSDGSVSVAVKSVGEATRALHQKKAGGIIGVRGPFGNGFTLTHDRILMVGGGTGMVPLHFLMKRLVSKAKKVVVVSGAKTKDELLFVNEIEKAFRRRVRLVSSTEDGSCGVMGLCTELVESILAKDMFDMIYGCGPEPMVRRVFELADEYKIRLEVSLERLMRCAVGLCGSCVIGRYRVCRDGPVFTGERLREVKEEFGFSKLDFDGRRITL